MKTSYRKLTTAILSLTFLAVFALQLSAQNFTNTGGGTYNATCGSVLKLNATNATVTGNNIGTDAANAIPGIVEWASTAADQNVGAYYYQRLVMSGGTKNMPNGVFVLGTACPTNLTGYSGLEEYGYFIANGTGNVTYTGTFTYAGTNQNIFPDQYNIIALTGTGANILNTDDVTAVNMNSNVGSDLTIAVGGSLTLGAGDSDFAGDVTVNGELTTGAGEVDFANLTNTGDITTGAGNVTVNNNLTSSGDITTGAGDLTVTGTASLTDGELLIAGTGDVIFNGATTTSENNTIQMTGTGDLTFAAALTLNGTLDADNGAAGAIGDVTFGGATTIGLTGELQLGNGTNLYISSTLSNLGDGTNLAFNCGSNVYYTADGQAVLPTISSNPYGNLFLSGGSKVGGSLAGAPTNFDVFLCGDFSLSGGNFDMFKGGTNSGTLVMTVADKTATYAANEEVVGSMRRTTDQTSRTYTFNNAQTQIGLAANTENPTNVTLLVRPGTAPNDYEPTSDVNRKVNMTYTLGDPGDEFEMTARVGYLASEGPGGGAWTAPYTQASVRFYETSTQPEREKVGTGQTPTRTAASGADLGFVQLAGIGNVASTNLPNDIDKFASGNDLVLAAGPTTFYSITDGRWTNPATWDEGTIPTSIDNAEIRTMVYAGIAGPFAGTLAAGNTTPEHTHYGGDAAAANSIIIANIAGSAFILGNEDNPDNYVFKTAQNTGVSFANNNTNSHTTAFGDGIPAKNTFTTSAHGFNGVWITPYGINIGQTNPARLGTHNITNAGTFNNEGVVIIAE